MKKQDLKEAIRSVLLGEDIINEASGRGDFVYTAPLPGHLFGGELHNFTKDLKKIYSIGRNYSNYERGFDPVPWKDKKLKPTAKKAYDEFYKTREDIGFQAEYYNEDGGFVEGLLVKFKTYEENPKKVEFIAIDLNERKVFKLGYSTGPGGALFADYVESYLREKVTKEIKRVHKEKTGL